MHQRSMSGREEEESFSLSLSLSVRQGLSEVGELLLRLACCKVSAVPGDGAGWHAKYLISHLSVSYKGSNPTF